MTSDGAGSAFSVLGQRELISRMSTQLEELLAARKKIEQLLRVIVEIGSDLDLRVTLHRIVVAAMELTSARYGALAVRDPDGTLVSFIHVGMDGDTVQRIGPLPVGKGLLDVSLVENRPLRLDDLATHPAGVGFPKHHPPMHALLSVPITIRQTMFGNLYLTQGQPGLSFTESDEEAAVALAVAAAVAIDHAQIFENLRESAQWTVASREITTGLLSGTQAPLQLIATRACELTEAEQAIVLVPTDPDLPDDEVETLVVSAAVGPHAAQLVGQYVPVQGSTTGGVFRFGAPVITESFNYPIEAFTEVGQRSAVVVPLRADGQVLGVLAIARNERRPVFDESALGLVGDFANHAAIALMLTMGRQHSRELDIFAERERIAHDLHDHVIQRVFATGLDLQSTIARAHSPEVVARLEHTVDDLQNIIEEIRTAIFRLMSRSAADGGFGARLQRVVDDLTANRDDIVTTVKLEGPMAAIGGELAEHAEAVTLEALSNAVRHSGASRLTVAIRAVDVFSIDITDNGRGIPADNQRRSGLASLQYRAERVGGSCQVTSLPEGGTRVHWTAPLTPC